MNFFSASPEKTCSEAPGILQTSFLWPKVLMVMNAFTLHAQFSIICYTRKTLRNHDGFQSVFKITKLEHYFIDIPIGDTSHQFSEG